MQQNNANFDKTNFNRFYKIDCCAAINGRVLLYSLLQFRGIWSQPRVSFFLYPHFTVFFIHIYIFVFWKTEWLDHSSKPTMLMHNIFISHYIPVNYVHAGKNAQRQILPSGHVTTSSVHVRARELSLRIDHFSWFIMTFFRKLFRLQTIQNHIEICCYSLLPTCIPLGRKVTLTVQIYKATKGMRKVTGSLIIQ